MLKTVSAAVRLAAVMAQYDQGSRADGDGLNRRDVPDRRRLDADRHVFFDGPGCQHRHGRGGFGRIFL